MPARTSYALSFAAMAALVAVSGCKQKDATPKPPAAVTGLAAIPADAEVVISFDVGRLATSQIVTRAAELLLQREPGLAARWSRLAEACAIEVTTQVRQVMLALGPAGKAGTPGLMVVTGDLPEARLAVCVQNAVGTGGGTLAVRTLGGRTIYTVTEADRTVWFGYGQADTVVLGTNQAWVEQALGTGPKLAESGALVPLLARADVKAPIWAAGRPGPAITAGLVRSTGGAMKQGANAVLLAVDPSAGLAFDLGVDLASEDDAKTLESFANVQQATLAMAAQAVSLGPLVSSLAIRRTGTNVTIGMALTVEQVNQLLRAIDTPPEDPQDSAPAVDAAPGPGSDAARKPK